MKDVYMSLVYIGLFTFPTTFPTNDRFCTALIHNQRSLFHRHTCPARDFKNLFFWTKLRSLKMYGHIHIYPSHCSGMGVVIFLLTSL